MSDLGEAARHATEAIGGLTDALGKPVDTVEVPPEFVARGFSGLFWDRAVCGGGERAKWEALGLPRLLGTTGWLVLRFEGEFAILVRSDLAALAEIARGGR